MAIQYDVVANIGHYEAGGQKKYVNRKVGVILDTQHGPSLKLDASFNPAGCTKDESGSVWLKLFPPKQQQQQNVQQINQQVQQPQVQHQAQQQPQNQGIDPDIPW